MAMQVSYLTLCISTFTWMAVSGAMIIVAPFVALTATLPQRQLDGIASLAGTLMIARSPASMVTPTYLVTV